MSNLESNINSCNINLENDYKLASSTSSSPLEYNKFLLKKEVTERNCLARQDEKEQQYTNEVDNEFLYPNLNDINFNIKIAEKKEFNDTKYDGDIHQNIKEYADMLAKADFELSPHQMFVKNFLSSQTPYNSLLLYHGLGTGKTLSAIGVCEEMRDYMKQMGITKRIMIVASENVQDNFRLQLFDERKLQLVDGVWTMKGGGSIGNKLLKEINPMNMKGIPKEKVVNQIKNLINTYYIFLGYGQFANYIIKTIHYDEEVKRSQMKQLGDQSKIQKIGAEFGDAKITLNKRIIRKLRNEFDNRLIVIDEVHNIRKTEDNENKKVALNLELLVKAAKNMRLVLLSATPMYNSYKEIIWLLNLMNMNDRRGIIQSKDVFDKNGNFKEGGEDILIRKATGYVSFVRGENPYTFPYRVYPNEFAKKNTFPFVEYPSYQMNLKKIKSEDKTRILGIYLNTIGNCGNCGMCQYCVYKYIIHSLRKKQFSITTKKGVTREMPSFENMESFGYTLLQTPLESLIISYPMKGLKEIIEKIPVEKYSEILDENTVLGELGENLKAEEFDVSNKDVEVSLSSIPSITESEAEIEDKSKVGGYDSMSSPVEDNQETESDGRKEAGLERTSTIDPHYLTGKKGLERMMDYVDQKSPPLKGDFEYKRTTLNEHGKIFSYNEIGKYSSKIKCILDKILVKKSDVDGNSKVAEGVILIYSQYIDSGLIPMALALEEFGFTRYGENVKNLFKNKPAELVDVRTMKPPTNKKEFMPARYAMITGDPRLSPNNDFEVKGLTNDDNKDGNKVKVILISKAGSEGIDFKFIRQVHILEPWYNMNRIEQIIGRGVRNFSHKDLPFEKRNVQIFMYGTILGDNKEEAADLYVFRVAELKATQTGNVTRLLKETAVDCIINHGQTNFTQETLSKYLNEEITQQLSTGLIIHDFKIGDAPFSPACDYMPTCNYVCRPTKDIDENNLNEDTYNDTFIKMNSEKINQKIRLLMKEGFFYKKETLIELINIPKKYPLVQIYAALTMLIDDNNEFIVDKYGRNGRLVNIGDYYLFQPIELLDKNISIYERSVPIDYKHSMISFDLKTKIGKSMVDNNIGVDADIGLDVGVDVHDKKKEYEYEQRKNKILAEMNENFDLTKEYLKPGTKVPRGDDNWFKHCGVVMRKIAREYPESRDYLLHFLIAHMIELLLFEEKIDLMNHIYSLKEIQMNSIEYLIKDYFERKSITTKNFNAMILYNLNKRKIMIFNNKSKKWIDAEPEDQREIAETSEVRDLLDFKVSDYNVIVGFMGYEKNNKYLIFKTKDMLSPRDTGARCDEAGKNKTMQILNQIIGEEKYTKENTKIVKDDNKNVIQDAVGHVELCVMQEFVLRFFDRIRKNDKKWFLSPEMALYHKLYIIHVK
jgi:hypothetical protein